MGNNLNKMLIKFHQRADQPRGAKVTEELLGFRTKLILEEVTELADAIMMLQTQVQQEQVLEEEHRAAQEHVLKELIDCMYVMVGTGVAFGWDIDKAFDLVHQSNMMKFKNGTLKDKDGKVLKNNDYEDPNLEDCL